MEWQNELKTAWSNREGPAIFATVSKDNMPNIIYVLGIKLLDDCSFAIIDNYFLKTKANIENGSKGAVLFLAKPRTAYQAKGTIEYFTSGPVYEDLRQTIDPKHPRIGAAVLRITELYSGQKKIF